MNKGRLEAFSDGVFAIIITIIVLDLRVPAGPSLEALRSTVPVFLSYVLSFVYVGIYWNNHHHLLHASERVSGPILWANLHHGASSRLATSIGKDRKGLASVIIDVVAIPLAFVWPQAAYGCYIFVAVMWLLPDPRMEKTAK
jgi:uncharacterized membrane protein